MKKVLKNTKTSLILKDKNKLLLIKKLKTIWNSNMIET